MKTAMQELIDWVECDNDNNVYDILDKAKELLEKEKEHIIDVMERTAMYVSAASLDKEIGKMTFEDLYNQTYNKID